MVRQQFIFIARIAKQDGRDPPGLALHIHGLVRLLHLLLLDDESLLHALHLRLGLADAKTASQWSETQLSDFLLGTAGELPSCEYRRYSHEEA